jgi:hypothetical protein
VVQAKQWQGLVESTHLSRTFSDQGVRLRLRKENRNVAGYAYLSVYKKGFALTSYNSSKRTLPYSPRSNTQAGPPIFGYDEDPNKRQRPNDHAPPQGYAITERAPLAYDPRTASQNMPPTPYGLQQQALLQSPQTSFGSRTPTAPHGWPHTQVFDTPHGPMSAPTRFLEGSIDTAQGIAPSPGAAGYGMQPAPPMGHDSGPNYSRRSTDSYMSLAQQPSPSTPYQGSGPMYIPTSGSLQGPAAYSTDHDSAAMARQHTQTHSVASPASSTRSGLIQAAPAYSMQQQPLQQPYGALSDNPQFEYPQYRQSAYQPLPPQTLLQQPSSNPNHEVGRHPQQPLGNPIDMRTAPQPSPYMSQSHPNLAIRPQQPGQPYASAQQQHQQYPGQLGNPYHTSGGVTYPTTQPPDQSRPY